MQVSLNNTGQTRWIRNRLHTITLKLPWKKVKTMTDRVLSVSDHGNYGIFFE